MDDLRGHLTPEVVHSSPDLPRPGQTNSQGDKRGDDIVIGAQVTLARNRFVVAAFMLPSQCLLSLPSITAFYHCLLSLPSTTAFFHCLLPLPSFCKRKAIHRCAQSELLPTGAIN